MAGRKKPNPLLSPVGRALAVQALQSEVLNQGLGCLLAEHGSEQRELLACLAVLLGVGAEVAAQVQCDGDNAPGLHQALAVVVRMAADGCRWDDAWGAQLQLALEVSSQLIREHSALAARVLPGACALSQDVKLGRVRADAIAPLVFKGEVLCG
ncbi:hypothetical protein G7045_10275 [Acidovorax sp. HDW3]|uniref:hypothetical protein n=1 Tax=Acidovorax sp. HDW3 TaxID=2714923 RepID=UPI00140B73D5|nr:hypothetical protein [Acidovorax sp. HDW3]QIL44617.1 hypothetical protein G7045_10275 [Acidovorax sp. HDW3]